MTPMTVDQLAIELADRRLMDRHARVVAITHETDGAMTRYVANVHGNGPVVLVLEPASAETDDEPEHVARIIARELARLTIAAGSELAMVRAGEALVFVTTGREADTLERLIRAQHAGGAPLT